MKIWAILKGVGLAALAICSAIIGSKLTKGARAEKDRGALENSLQNAKKADEKANEKKGTVTTDNVVDKLNSL